MEQSSMEEIYRLLNAGNRILVTDFDKTITEIGSSIYASVHVLGKNSSFGQAREALYQVLSQAFAGRGGILVAGADEVIYPGAGFGRHVKRGGRTFKRTVRVCAAFENMYFTERSSVDYFSAGLGKCY